MRTARCTLLMIALTAIVAEQAALPPPTRGISFTFEQISWLNNAGGFRSRYSDWGEVKMTLGSGDHGLFYPMTVGSVAGWGGYVSIVSDAGGAPSWEVMNLPIFYKHPAELDGRLPQGVCFDLGVTPGTAVTGLNYYYAVAPLPLAGMPAGTSVSAAVTEEKYLAGGDRLWLGSQYVEGAGAAAPAPAEDFPGAAPGESVASVASISGSEKDIAAVNEDVDGCAPGSTARSLDYLDNTHSNVNTPYSAQQLYGYLYNAMGTTSPGGTQTANILSGKNAVVNSLGLPINSTQTKDFKKAMDTLKNQGDVEMGVFWGNNGDGSSAGAHRTFVSEIQELQDASGTTTGYVVKTVDDSKQGDGNATNASHTMKFDAAGNLLQYDGNGARAGAGLINFQTQDVYATKDPLWSQNSLNVYPLPPGGWSPKFPFGTSPPVVISDVQVRYDGILDAGGGTVGSRLVANPRAVPPPSPALELDLVDVQLTPADPTQPTNITIRTGFAHLSPDGKAGSFLPVIPGGSQFMLENLVSTSSFFDVTYQVSMPGETPQIFRLHGEVAELLRGKAWFNSMESLPSDGPDSFFDVFLAMTVMPNAYELLGSGKTFLNMQLMGEQVSEPAVAVWHGGTLPPGSATLWTEAENWTGTGTLPPNERKAQVTFGTPGSTPIVDLADSDKTVAHVSFLGGVGTTIEATGDPQGRLVLGDGVNRATVMVEGPAPLPAGHRISAPVHLFNGLDVVMAHPEGMLTISGPINGAGSVALEGMGTLVLSGSNGYYGGTEVRGGTLRVENASALPPGGNLTIGAGGTVVLSSDLSAAAGVGSAIGGSAAVPEPGTLALLAAGMLGTWALRMRRRA